PLARRLALVGLDLGEPVVGRGHPPHLVVEAAVDDRRVRGAHRRHHLARPFADVRVGEGDPRGEQEADSPARSHAPGRCSLGPGSYTYTITRTRRRRRLLSSPRPSSPPEGGGGAGSPLLMFKMIPAKNIDTMSDVPP